MEKYATEGMSERMGVSIYSRQLPIEKVTDENGAPMILEVPYPGRVIYSHIWRVYATEGMSERMGVSIYSRKLAYALSRRFIRSSSAMI